MVGVFGGLWFGMGCGRGWAVVGIFFFFFFLSAALCYFRLTAAEIVGGLTI